MNEQMDIATGHGPVRIARRECLSDADLDGLAAVLADCVAGGASVGFMQPLPVERARAFWSGLADDVAAGRRALLVAEDPAGILGTVQLILGLPENQPHRADIAKMLVHRRARRTGVGAALMRAAESVARAEGRSVLVLDAASPGDAERLYRRLGWQAVGIVPHYALMPDGGRCDTCFYFRRLAPEPA